MKFDSNEEAARYVISVARILKPKLKEEMDKYLSSLVIPENVMGCCFTLDPEFRKVEIEFKNKPEDNCVSTIPIIDYDKCLLNDLYNAFPLIHEFTVRTDFFALWFDEFNEKLDTEYASFDFTDEFIKTFHEIAIQEKVKEKIEIDERFILFFTN